MDAIQTKIDRVKNQFNSFKDKAEVYEFLVSLGKKRPSPPPEICIEKNRVKSCQSILYIECRKEGELHHFTPYSEALISLGLATLMCEIYSNETLETLLRTKPFFLDEIQLLVVLSPGRALGLKGIYPLFIRQALLFC